MTRSICLLPMFFINSLTANAQKTSDVKFLFKTWLFLEHVNTESREAILFPVKDSALFSLWQNAIELKLDTLKKTGFSKDYIFVSISLKKLDIPLKDFPIVYKQWKMIDYLDMPVDSCGAYVLCVNKRAGISYRLRGFRENDFLGLYRDIRGDFEGRTTKRLSIRRFLKQYTVNDLDFECLYEGLTSNKVNLKEFPCLQRCANDVVVIR